MHAITITPGVTSRSLAEAAESHDPHVLSPSGIETWNACQRKGGFIYISGLRPESNKSAALGGKVHKQLENYLKTGEAPDYTELGNVGNIAASVLYLLPKPGTLGMKVEGYFKFQSPETGIWYRGYKDVTLAPEPPGRPRPTVLDHKTTSSIASWAKTPEDLQEDTQAILYAYDELLKYPDADGVDLQWTYAQTKGALRGAPVRVTLTKSHVFSEFARIELGAKNIISTLELGPNPMTLAPSWDRCTDYGGCPFLSKCTDRPTGPTFAGIGASDNKRRLPTMSLLPSTSVLNNLGTPAPEPPPSRLGGGLLGSMLAVKTLEAKEIVLAPNPTIQLSGEVKTVSIVGSIYAPGCEPPAADPNVIPAAFANPAPVNDQPINPPEALLPQPVTVETAAITTEEKPKGKRRRPAGSKNRTAPVEEPTAPVLPGQMPLFSQSGPPSGRAPYVEPASSQEPKEEGYKLFINCQPDGFNPFTVRGEYLIGAAHDEIRAEKQVGDYRFVEFGKGAGMLSARVAELAKVWQRVLLDTRSPEGMLCRDALVANAQYVVRGL